MLAAAVLAFAFSPLSHGPLARAAPAQSERAFFIGDMVRLVPQRELPFQPRETATPVLDDAGSRLYVGTSDGWVRCRFHGRTAWFWRAGGSGLAAPLLDRDTLYVASADGKLTALNRITGEVRWSSDLHEELTTTPTLSGGRLYVMSSEESVTGVDAETGKSLWKFHRDPPAGFTIRGNSRPRVSHGSVFAGFADGPLVALGRADGKVLWKLNLGNDRYATPGAVSGGLLLLSLDRGPLIAVDAVTGRTRGAFDPGSGFSAGPLAIPGAAFAVSNGGVLF